MNAKRLICAVLMSAVFSAPAFAGPADESLDAAASQYRSTDARGQWHNPWMPQATGSPVAQGPSTDERLMQIVAAHTRDALDRGGWQNTVLTNSRYASGNALLTVRVGEGVTTGGVAGPREAPSVIALHAF